MSTTQTAVQSPAATWNIDAAHSHVEFAIRHLMISTVKGRFAEYTVVRTAPNGKLVYDCVQGADEAKRLANTPVSNVDPKSGLEVR